MGIILPRYLKLHIIVLILGFTAILGKLILLPAVELVWYRMLIAFISIFIYSKINKISFRIALKEIFKMFGIGVVVAAHWICFFHAIKVSNVSVTLGCIAATTLFTSFLEPLSQHKKIRWLEVVIGLIIIAGLYMIFQFETRYVLGIFFALTCALLAAVFNVLNKNITDRYDGHVIGFYEMVAGFISISIYMLCTENISEINLSLTTSDLIYLLLLGSVCTAYAYVVTIDLMKKLSAYIVILSINLEPVYGILAAYFIFGSTEYMTLGFYAGTLLITASVFVYPVLKRRYFSKV